MLKWIQKPGWTVCLLAALWADTWYLGRDHEVPSLVSGRRLCGWIIANRFGSSNTGRSQLDQPDASIALRREGGRLVVDNGTEYSELFMWVNSDWHEEGWWATTSRWIDLTVRLRDQDYNFAGEGPAGYEDARSMLIERLAHDPATAELADLLEKRAGQASGGIVRQCVAYGMVHDTIALAIVAALVWSLGWIPTRIVASSRERRRERGVCAMCAYDLAGVSGLCCPECGASKEA